MKYQFYILKEVLKKSLKYIIFFYVMIGIDIMFFLSANHFEQDIYTKLMSFILLPTKENIDMINYLVVFYNLILIIYIVFSYMLYEKNHSYENTALRFDSKRYFICKIILITLFVLIYTFVYFSFLSLFFSVSIDSTIILNYLIYVMLIPLVVFSILNILKGKKIFTLLSILIFIIYTLFFKINIAIVIYLLLCIINYSIFNVRLQYDE